MDQANRYLTQAIVGAPTRLTLGTEPGGTGLRHGGMAGLATGHWVRTTLVLGGTFAVSVAATDVLTGRLEAMWSSASRTLDAASGKPVVQPVVAAASNGLHDVALPNGVVGARAVGTEGGLAEGLAKDGPLPNHPATTSSQAAGEAIKVAPVAAPADREKAAGSRTEKDTPVAAVVLDAKPVELVSAKEVAAAKTLTGDVGAGRRGSPTAAAALTQATAPAAGVHPMVTLVDIERDGAYVLITDPQSRLPQKFAAGQKIFTGETITKIDPARGRVWLDSRFVELE